MNIKFFLVLLVLVMKTSLGGTVEENLTAKEIMEKSREVVKLAGSEAVSTMTIIDSKGRERVRQIAQATKLFDDGRTEKKIIRFLSPADVKGTGLLTFDYEDEDDDMWLFMPALRKTRRIVSSEKAKNFMGSEFSYADISPSDLEDFTYEIVGESEVGEESCWEIETVPKDEDIADENGFSQRLAYIGKKDFVIRKAVYYDLDGELHKELSVLEIKHLDTSGQKYRPTHMVMVNKQNDRRSVLKIDKIEFNPEVNDEFFTTRYLERY